jgi:hypothetical protein
MEEQNPQEQPIEPVAEQVPQEVPQQPAPVQQQPQEQPQEQPAEPEYGPRRLSFFTLVLKTFAGLGGGIAGTAVLLLIFLAASSILQPVLGAQAELELMEGEISPLFMVVLMGMILATSLVSSLAGPLFIAYTERERYTRISTMMGQIFIINMVIFMFVLPIYLTTSTTQIELTAYAAGLQVILSTTASVLIMELVHDNRYALLAVYNTILAILVGAGVNFMLYFISGSATVLLFAALPIIWGLIGFSQAAGTMIYYWIFQTWGTDFLASTASFGTDYGIPDQTEEEEEALAPDVEGGDFLNQ